jgi:antitoxin (DNA-binding transcriptional repressor) of toxin-antitoxin stability system
MHTFKVYLKGNLKDTIMTIIGLKELSQNAGKIADRVAKGERFTVVKRSKPVFEISKPSATNNHSQEELQDWTKEAIDHYRPALTELSKK